MSKVLSTLMAAAFAAISMTAIATDVPKSDASKAKVAEVKKNDKAIAKDLNESDTVAHPAGAAAATSTVNTTNGQVPDRISMNVTVAKQTQGATFGEKVNAGLHAAGSALSQGAAVVGGALPGDAVITASAKKVQADASAGGGADAVSSVGNLAGGAGGGAAAASYARTGSLSTAPDGDVSNATPATATPTADDDDDKAAAPEADPKKASTKHDTAKNSVGNIR